jgi:hypothetical protein
MNTAFDHCKTVRRVTKRELINALHQVTLQLSAIGQRVEVDGMAYDNNPAIREGERVITKAGHIGFTP